MFRKGGKTTAINAQERKKLHTTFDDGSELIEEYDLKTDELLVRKRRAKTKLGAVASWEYLVGDAPVPGGAGVAGGDGPVIRESTANPIFTRKDLEKAFQWRIRNVPYPADVFQVTVEPSERKIIVRTTTKKYYKKFDIPELDLLQLPYEPARLQFYPASNTLVITYAKPQPVLEAEAEDKADRRKLRAEEDGDVGCNQQ